MTRALLCIAILCSTAHAGTITGRVVQDGFRVAEYGVYLTGGYKSPTPVRDGDGRFTLRDVPSGRHQLAIVGWTFEKRLISVEVTESIDLGTITVEAGRELGGRVVDAAGEPVSGATVLVFDQQPVDISAPLELMAADVRVATSGLAGEY